MLQGYGAGEKKPTPERKAPAGRKGSIIFVRKGPVLPTKEENGSLPKVGKKGRTASSKAVDLRHTAIGKALLVKRLLDWAPRGNSLE